MLSVAEVRNSVVGEVRKAQRERQMLAQDRTRRCRSGQRGPAGLPVGQMASSLTMPLEQVAMMAAKASGWGHRCVRSRWFVR